MNQIVCGTEAPSQLPPPIKSGLDPEEEIVQFMRLIAKSLVDHPSEVKVNAIIGPHTTVLELNVAKEDLGRMIGRQGRTAQAIRILLTAVASKNQRKIVLEIIE